MIKLSDIVLEIKPDVLEAIPQPVQDFLNNELHSKWANVNGWGWCEIDWEVTIHKLPEHCIKLCFTGSPSMDIGVTWVYNTVSNQYEEYLTQYHNPVSVIKRMNTYSSFDEVLSTLNLLTFEDLERLF